MKLASTITDKYKEQEKKITKLTIIIVVIFTVCNLYDNIYQILRGTNYKEWKENKGVYGYLPAFYAPVLNSSINFIVYGFFNPKFRTVLVSIFCTETKLSKVEIILEQR